MGSRYARLRTRKGETLDEEEQQQEEQKEQEEEVDGILFFSQSRGGKTRSTFIFIFKGKQEIKSGGLLLNCANAAHVVSANTGSLSRFFPLFYSLPFFILSPSLSLSSLAGNHAASSGKVLGAVEVVKYYE